MLEHKKRLWTGFKDGNGVKIYNGDFLRYDSNYTELIICDEDGRYMSQKEKKRAEELVGFHSTEVIGNIWENPELVHLCDQPQMCHLYHDARDAGCDEIHCMYQAGHDGACVAHD